MLKHSKVRMTYAVTLVIALSGPRVHAEPRRTVDPPAPPPPTFKYTTPAEPNALRAILELGGVLALGFAWYASTSTDIVHQWDVNYDFQTFEDKLTGEAFGQDTNHFGTNFIGHPLGGAGYYLAARSNRLRILESFGYSIAGSLLWELFGEVSEVVSLNDSLVTPVAGLAIGESTTQLGAFFDRSGPNIGNRVLGTVFGPFKSMNDALDGLKPARASSAFPDDEWHRFDLRASATAVYEDTASRAWWPEAEIVATSRLARLAGYEAPGQGSQGFDDGNLSALELRAAFGRPGLTDFLFAAQIVLAGHYFRSSTRGSRGGVYGGNGVLGVATTFRYALHDYTRDESDPIDRIASVEPVALVFEHKGSMGTPKIATRIDAGPNFAGVTPHAAPALSSRSALPKVYDVHGYYFAIGGHLEAAMDVADGPIEASANMRAESYREFVGPGDPTFEKLRDVATYQSLRLAYRLHDSPAALVALANHRGRTGRFGSGRALSSEYAVGAGFGGVF